MAILLILVKIHLYPQKEKKSQKLSLLKVKRAYIHIYLKTEQNKKTANPLKAAHYAMNCLPGQIP